MIERGERIVRREFLSRASVLASGALIAAPRRALCRAPDAPRAIGLGFSLYGMKAMTIDAALQALAEIGYDCVELPVMSDWPADSARFDSSARRALRGQLAGRGLRLTALMENLPALGDETQHRANLERLKRAAEFSLDLQASNAKPLIETILGGKSGEFEAVKERLVERLREWATVAEKAEVKVAVKAHIGNATQRPEQLLWLLDQVASPWLVAAYDYSHFQLQGLKMEETLEALLPRSAFIHVKDAQRQQDKPAFLLPGEGTIDYAAMFTRLARSTYRGDVIVEVSSQVFNRAGYEPLAAARKCYTYLAEAFRSAGVTRG